MCHEHWIETDVDVLNRLGETRFELSNEVLLSLRLLDSGENHLRALQSEAICNEIWVVQGQRMKI